ncbi:MAG TPA: alpha/beta hydrolase [Candidatus Sulfotelmatobacter sp.]|jgi:pimeloyl-ACP methyl ester carboxylesterase|nr:alpha/beta hydrolase [Candidatus Sulfotelmatobacter sp.]
MTGWKSSVRRILITVAIIYVLVCICGCALQRRLLYFPTVIPADVVETVAKNHGFEPWKNPAGEIVGWKKPANTNFTGSVLIVHGNAGCALGRDYIAQPVHDAASVDVYVLEYPGYGARSGSPSKASFDAAAEEAFQLLPKNLPRYVVSESIGAGVAGELAKNHPSEIAGVAMFVPYQNLASVAQRRMWFLPAYVFLLDRFNPEECLKQYHGPIKFLIAGDDEVIGPASGLRLANGYAGAKEIQVIPGAHHNDVAEQNSDWWREVFSFWQKNAINK